MTALTTDEIILVLNDCLPKLSNSMAAYILESNPYLTKVDKDATAAMAEIAKTDLASANEIVHLIKNLEGIPYVGMSDPRLAELNYLSYPLLLDAESEDKKNQLQIYEDKAEALDGSDQAKELLDKIVQDHKDQIEKLKGIRERRYSKDEDASS